MFFSSGFFQDFSFIFDFLQYKYNMPRCRFLYLSCLVFSEFPESVVWYLILIWGSSKSQRLQILFLFLFLLLLLMVFPLYMCYILCSFPTVNRYSILRGFFSVFVSPYAFQFWKLLLRYLHPQVQRYFSHPCPIQC